MGTSLGEEVSLQGCDEGRDVTPAQGGGESVTQNAYVREGAGTNIGERPQRQEGQESKLFVFCSPSSSSSHCLSLVSLSASPVPCLSFPLADGGMMGLLP